MSFHLDSIPGLRPLEDAQRIAWVHRRAPQLIQKFETTRWAYGRARLASSPAELDRLVLENFRYTCSYYARFAQLSIRRRRTRLQTALQVDCLPLLHSALAPAKGAILVSPHLGDFDLAGSWLAQLAQISVTTVVDTVTPRIRQSFFDSCRKAAGLNLRYESQTRLSHLEADLQSGNLLVLMLDRRVRGPAAEVPFFGSPALLSLTPYLLSLRTGAPILTGAVTSTPGEQPRGRITSIRGSEIKRLGPQAAMAAIARQLEDLIRASAAQWHIPADPRQLPWQIAF